MTRDPKQTQTLEEPREQPARSSQDQELAMRTTLVQPIPLSRHPDFVRTHYWERLDGEREEPKRTAASYASAGKTVVGMGPDDPIIKAVQAAKQQLLEAERAQQERQSHERPRVAQVASASSASTAKTVLLPALDVMQLMASRAKSVIRREPAPIEEPVQLPKRKLTPFVIAGAALLCAAMAGYLMPARPPAELTAPSIVKPRPQPAPASSAPEQHSESAAPAPALAADSVHAPAPTVQITEKAAVDALFAGDYGLASRHYAALASAHPEQPAFAEASRILKRSIGSKAK